MIPTQDLGNNGHLEFFGQVSQKSPWESILRMENELREHHEFIRFIQRASGLAECISGQKKRGLEQDRT